MVYYGVLNGRIKGIFLNWEECNKSVKGYKESQFKKFNNILDAEQYIISRENPIKPIKPIDYNDKEDDTDYYVYTDGSCINNGRYNAKAGIGIYFGMNDKRNISRRIKGKQTNNTAELKAIINTYYIIENDILNGKKITIVSDSVYAINCAGSYGAKNEMLKWKNDIPNKELVKEIYELYKNIVNIKFMYVEAHTKKTDNHSIGNDNADKLARDACK
jgi:ribonuclease HI